MFNIIPFSVSGLTSLTKTAMTKMESMCPMFPRRNQWSWQRTKQGKCWIEKGFVEIMGDEPFYFHQNLKKARWTQYKQVRVMNRGRNHGISLWSHSLRKCVQSFSIIVYYSMTYGACCKNQKLCFETLFISFLCQQVRGWIEWQPWLCGSHHGRRSHNSAWFISPTPRHVFNTWWGNRQRQTGSGKELRCDVGPLCAGSCTSGWPRSTCQNAGSITGYWRRPRWSRYLRVDGSGASRRFRRWIYFLSVVSFCYSFIF